MAAEIKIETKEFRRALDRYLVETSQELSKAINRRMFHVLKKAEQYTPKADRSAIMAELGAEDKMVKSRKTGEIRRRGFKIANTKAERIIQGSRLKRGEKPLPRNEIKKEARKLIASRLRSVGTLKAGWYHAKLAMAKAGGVFGGGKTGPRVKQRSFGKPAKAGLNPTAKAVYRLLAKGPNVKSIHPKVEQALARAYAAERVEMERHMRDKAQKVADKYNSR